MVQNREKNIIFSFRNLHVIHNDAHRLQTARQDFRKKTRENQKYHFSYHYLTFTLKPYHS